MKKKRNRPAPERFWDYVQKTETCWLWIGCKNKKGYGWFSAASRKQVLAHRYSYELSVGPIPEGAELDHGCRVRNCVNPSHLEAVSHAVNIARAYKTHCKNGHEYSTENTLLWKCRGKVIRTCRYCYTKNHGFIPGTFSRSNAPSHP